MTLLRGLDPDVAYPATASVPDSDLHSRVRYLTYGALREHFAGRGDCFVGQDLNIYYRHGDPRIVVAPDVFVCFGVDAEALRNVASYRVWEAGAPPAFVLEIASENTYPADLEEKPAKYLELGVDEYWRLDPTGGDFFVPMLQAERRRGDTWEAIDVIVDGDGVGGGGSGGGGVSGGDGGVGSGSSGRGGGGGGGGGLSGDGGGGLRGHSGVLNLDLHAERHRLRFSDPRTGDRLLDPTEMRHDRDAAVARAEAAEARAAAAEAELTALRTRPNDRP